MSNSKNRNASQASLSALRRAGAGLASVLGYQDHAGRPVAQRGNDKAPYVWSPPFAAPRQSTGLVAIGDEVHTSPTRASDGSMDWGTCFPAIDVADYRVISLIVEYVGSGEGIGGEYLQMLPLVDLDPYDGLQTAPSSYFAWTPMAFVNANPTAVNVALDGQSTPAIYRSTGALMLHTPTTPGGAGPTFTNRLSLDFEVGSHKKFTVSTAQVGGAFGTYTARYFYTRRM